ncbi:MAG: cell division protein FtsH, partial [Solirubrobacteraceae bacterium]
MPRDKRGWHVSPAPDGRGMPEQPPSGPPPHRRPSFWWFVLFLIALNWLSVLIFAPATGQQRVTVSFNPFFLEQVKSGHVKSIASKGDTIQGTFKSKLRYP